MVSKTRKRNTYRKKKKGGNKSNSQNQSKSKRFVRLNCSPTTEQKEYTCYTDEKLLKMRDIWNARHPDHMIQSKDSKEIWTQLKELNQNVCNKESCWIRQMTKNTALEKELLDVFAPKSPEKWKKNPNEWLSSLDIIEVMNQYEKKYKCFEFLGPSPIDYDSKEVDGKCVWEELCNFKLQNQIKNGKNKIGVIFNLDPHYKGGSHWVSLFINIKKKYIYFFDSTGDAVPNQIKKFVDMVTEQGKAANIHFTFDQNHPVEHQYGNTECGIYSIYFIIHMLQDKINGHYLKTHVLKDKYMQEFRKVYFNEDL
jgi:Ulp1 protease family, C-terminal catalytic domain